MDPMSPTVAMSASPKAKKVSIPDDPPLLACITEVVETLNRPEGAVRLTREHVTNVREHLSELGDIGGEVDPHMLEAIVDILGKDAAACRRLKVDAFSLLTEVLLVTKESNVRARGLYILGESLHKERLGATRKDLFQGRLDLIGQGCLLKLYDRFTGNSVPYNSRRWIGTLVLELIGESEDNQGIIALMSTSQRAKLGSCILSEASEILRAITGRIITVMLAADHPITGFFPPGTADKLFAKYPGPAHSASQWDKTFQEYLDEIWDEFCADNESNGQVQFAQNIIIEPSHASIRDISARHRSIYVELSDNVRVYSHSGKDDFDSAIDIPLTSIGGIATSLTAVDGAQQMKLVDVVLKILPSALCFVNSLHAPMSVLRLTVADREIADSIVDGLSSATLHIAEETIIERQVAASSPARADSQGSSQSKKSCGEENLVLDGSYAAVHDSYVEGLVTPSNALANQDEQANLEKQVDDEEEANIASAEQESNLARKRKGPKEAKDLSVLVQKGKAPATTEHDTVLKHTFEVDVVRDVDTGDVLTSEVLKIGLDASKKPKLNKQSTVKPSSIAESSDRLAEDDTSSSSDPPQKESAVIQDYPNHREALPPPETTEALKSKAPIRAPNTGKQRLAADERTRKHDTSISKSKTNSFLSSPETAESPNKSQLVLPTKKSTNTTAKLQPANRVLGTHLGEGDIYDLSSSPPKTKKAVKGAGKGKKAAPPAKSNRTSGGKIKDRKNPLTNVVEEQGNFLEPHLSLSRSKKETLTKKVAQKVPLETATTTSRGKRTTASRSTKGKKNMKDLTDSDIEELVAEETSMGEEIGVIRSREMEKEKGAKVDLGTQEPVAKTKATELGITVPKESHKITGASTFRKGHVFGQPIARQRAIDEEPNNFNTPGQQQAKSSPAHPSNIQDAFHDATVVAAIAGSDDLDKALPPTAEIQNPAATVEAKIGRRMAEIFRSVPVNTLSDSQKNIDGGMLPQRPSTEGLKSNSPLESEGGFPDVLVGSHIVKPLPIRSEEIEKAIDDDEFIVLSSPPKIIGTEAVKNSSKVAELSSAQDPIVVPGPDEKYSQAPNLSRTSAEKHMIAAPLVDNPSKRLRATKAAVLSQPPQGASAPLSKRGAIKAKAHARKQATPAPQSSPLLASEKDHGSSIDDLTLVDDHQARKTPLIAFGPHGPRNQGLSSAVKATRIINNEDKPNSLAGIPEKLSKQSADQGPSPTEQSKKRNDREARRLPRVPGFEASLAQFSTAAMVDRFEQDDSGMAFFDAEQSTACSRSRSHSRVDINGSPQPKRPSLAPRDSLSRVANDLVFGSNTRGDRRRPQRQMVAIERNSNDEAAFEDDITLFDSGFFISSNRKVRPAAPQDDLDFASRYTPHHSTVNGVYVGVANQNVIDAAPDMPDPFNNKLKRQDSDFARKLRVSVNQEAAREAQLPEPPAAKAQSPIRHSIDTVPQPSRLRSLVDADTTLVDIENRAPRRSKKSRRHESSTESSDSGANKKDGRDDPITPTPQEIWREALKPHQQDVSDVLHHVVDGLLKKLFDKEPAVQAIANEYRANGAKIVEGLKSKMGAEVQALNVHATSIIEDLAKSLRQSRAALQASSGGSRELDEQYKAWRAKQHALQNLPFMARESSSRRS